MSTTDDKDDYTHLDKVNKKNFEIIKNRAIKIGYAEGVHDGRESVFQNGFDQGYKDGLTTSFNLEKFRFFFMHLSTDDKINKDFVKEREVYKTLPTVDLKCLQLKDNSINSIPQNHLEDTVKNLMKRMPVTTSMLNGNRLQSFKKL